MNSEQWEYEKGKDKNVYVIELELASGDYEDVKTVCEELERVIADWDQVELLNIRGRQKLTEKKGGG